MIIAHHWSRRRLVRAVATSSAVAVGTALLAACGGGGRPGKAVTDCINANLMQ